MGIKENSGVETETREESETKVTKSLLKEQVGSERKKREKEGSS